MIDNKTSDADAVRDMYDSSAESYSEMMDTEIDHPLYSDTLGRLQESIANLQGVLIDAPCGSGHMLSMFHDRFDNQRPLIGVDLSPGMVGIAAKRLGSAAEIGVGDIRVLDNVPSDTAAAVMSHFAFHHLDADGVSQAITEWHRVLCTGGQLIIGAWAGSGELDYGPDSDLIAVKHEVGDLERVILGAGFSISKSYVEFDDGMMMDAVYIEATKE